MSILDSVYMNINFSCTLYIEPGCVVWHHKQVHKDTRGGGFRGTPFMYACIQCM